MPSMPRQVAALPRLDDGARAGDVALERVLELLDRVQPRLGRSHLDGLVARSGRCAGDVLVRERRLARGILRASARVEQLFLAQLGLARALGVAVQGAARGDLERLRPFARGALFRFEPLGIRSQAAGVRAPFGLARRVPDRGGLDLAQPREDRIEVRASLRERRLRRELALARSVDLAR